MRKQIFTTLLLTTILLFSFDAVAIDKQHVRPVEKWEIESVSDDGDNTIDFCLARTYYNNGIILIIARDKYAEQRLALNFPDNRLSVGENYPVNMSIDTVWKQSVNAFASSPNMLVTTFDDGFDFIKTAGEGYTLTMKSTNDSVEFDLSGAGQALEKMKQCISKKLPNPPLKKTVEEEIVIADTPPKKTVKKEKKTFRPIRKEKPKAQSRSLPYHILSALNSSGFKPKAPKAPSNENAKIPLDAVWGYGDIMAGYKTVKTSAGAFSQSIKYYINTIRPLCDGPFIAEASPVYTVGKHNFMHAEIGCSSTKRDSIASLLFYQHTPTTIDALYIETESSKGSDAISMRNKISRELEVKAKK